MKSSTSDLKNQNHRNPQKIQNSGPIRGRSEAPSCVNLQLYATRKISPFRRDFLLRLLRICSSERGARLQAELRSQKPCKHVPRKTKARRATLSCVSVCTMFESQNPDRPGIYSWTQLLPQSPLTRILKDFTKLKYFLTLQ